MLSRHPWVLIHRYSGLTMAGFLVIVGLTGSLIAFRSQIDHLVSPRFFAKPQPAGAARLDFAALTDRAEVLVPHGNVYWIIAYPDQIRVMFSPRKNPATGRPYELGLETLFLDPWTGQELARLRPGEHDPTWLTGIVVSLHAELCLGSFGYWLMGIVALIWTLDCFVGFYLTLPQSSQGFWQRWNQAWRVKWKASASRVNFDLHRASGLWLWPVLFVFAWSSVLFNLPAVYHRVTDRILEYKEPTAESRSVPPPGGENQPPRIDFRAAISTAHRLIAEQAASHGFSVGQQECVLQYEEEERKYFYLVRSSRDISDRDHIPFTTLTFDADTGAVRSLHIPTGEHAGNTFAHWLESLHLAAVFGLPYRVFVSLLGVVIAMLSYTGVYIWWRKMGVRKQAALAKASIAGATAGVCI